MTSPSRPPVQLEQYHASLPVADLAAAIEFYVTRLGFEHSFSWGEPPMMAGVELGGAEIFLQSGDPDLRGCALFFLIDDADRLFDFHVANGLEVVEPIADRPYEMRDYAVRDLDGHRLSFGHRMMPRGPALEIERVEVPVRLERRLAAVLADLAVHKGMTVGECLEETLLHTFEPWGDGVASPHTKRDLRRIEELKRQHGLDYECHASYRFREREPGA